MVGLGPAFGTKEIKGPVVVCYLQIGGRDLYLVGEEHGTNGTFQHDIEKHVVNQMIEYSKKKNITVYSEFTLLQLQNNCFHFSNMEAASEKYYGDSPNGTYGYYVFNNSFSHPNKTVIIDSRKMTPYDIYIMIVDPSVYCFEHHYQTYFEMLPTVRKWAKQAEKAIINNIRTRRAAKAFLESLYMPGLDYPQWYKQLFMTITNSIPTSPLRDRMQQLQQQLPDAYHRLVNHMRTYYYGRWARTPYTVAMDRVQSARRTINTKMVASKKPNAKNLFVEITSYLLDLNAILEFLMSKDDTVFLMAGLAHVDAIAHFFDPFTTIYMKADKHGNIPSGDAMHAAPNLRNRAPNVLKELAGT